MSLATSLRLLQRVAVPALQPSRALHVRGKATMVSAAMRAELSTPPAIRSALPAQHLTAKVMFDDHTYADFKYIWLRDNCQCPKCIDSSTKQKLVDTPNLDVNLKPLSLTINAEGMLQISWAEADGQEHISIYDPAWLFKYGQSFMHNNFASDTVDMDLLPQRPEMELWDRTSIWASFPELSYNEFMETEGGLADWLDMFYRYGVAVLRGVPTEPNKIVDVVKRFAYVKETQYGTTFDVINKPVEGAHLAYTGVALSHHTDMNYREKSPGMQLLHCLKANDPKLTGEDPGGRSFFADGFRIARWLEENEPAAYHILTSTPIRFSIKNEGKQYSALWPVLCTNTDGDVTEVHYNNRTMKPLQAPTHVVTPFYQAYRLFSERLCDPAMGLEFNMVPGDLVAFNNRRVLHGRTAFDASKVDRHLQGCYVDIDEAFAKYDSLRAKISAPHPGSSKLQDAP
ncbi:gamma-butyrobetaine dioxygenase-like isoform X1 [Penaeus japonicus]|uniref:gamma-butyrobetaine dioxygenase-like isoform X1 n=1 Tax=Penaeus japonicus TaxID=27405 RepID=UPI001C710E5E|nr:gamma-butyrobetaine dioxygenase-like isoform X1 [Penaeus japonicus]